MKIRVIDSHTGGEPTRLVVTGGPDLGVGPMSERLQIFRSQQDRFRSAVVNEPRGSDAMVGALLCEPTDPDSSAGVLFFNNVGYLGMCVHGTIGLLASLAYLDRVKRGVHQIETPVGLVQAELHPTGEVTVSNVSSYRYRKAVTVNIGGLGNVTGDIAWGGNWFFLVSGCSAVVDIRNVEELTDFAWEIRRALRHAEITGANGEDIDHIEIFGEDGRNFVLCPGKAYDRSPCGTGTSAKVSCLYADGKLKEGEIWRQTSMIGSVFEATVTVRDGNIRPSIKGIAYVTGESYLMLDDRDPFCWGIRP